MNEELDELLRRDPFVPFVVVMNSGDRYEIRVPELAVKMKDVMYIVRPKSDRRDVIRLNQISSLEILGAD